MRDLTLEHIDSKEQLNAFLALPEVRRYARIFQTWEWGEFQRAQGNAVHRLGVYADDDLVATAVLAQSPDRFGPFLYGARGPVTDYSDHARAEAVVQLLAREGRRLSPRSIGLRLDPAILASEPEAVAFSHAGFRPAARFIQAERCWIVDLQPTHAAQVAWQKDFGMRGNLPRYLRRAEREGVVVRASDRPEDLEIFLDMLLHLHDRKGGIGVYPRDYYRRQFAALAPSGYERVFIAERGGEPLAAALIATYGDEASYLWGASYDRRRELRAPHFMHFQIMRYAYQHGCTRYNFWGVVRAKNHYPEYAGYGYSEFKRSFGGYPKLYLRTQDYVYRPLPYALTWLNDQRRMRSWQIE